MCSQFCKTENAEKNPEYGWKKATGHLLPHAGYPGTIYAIKLLNEVIYKKLVESQNPCQKSTTMTQRRHNAHKDFHCDHCVKHCVHCG